MARGVRGLGAPGGDLGPVGVSEGGHSLLTSAQNSARNGEAWSPDPEGRRHRGFRIGGGRATRRSAGPRRRFHREEGRRRGGDPPDDVAALEVLDGPVVPGRVAGACARGAGGGPRGG